jgi:hypothetical protein
MYALDVNTGELILKTANPSCSEKENCFPGNSAAPAVIPGIVFAGSLDGHVRGGRLPSRSIVGTTLLMNYFRPIV